MITNSCIDKDPFDNDNNTEYSPVFMNRDVFENAIEFNEARNLVNPAKIYYKDHYTFITERFEGIHIFDVLDPANPVNKGFLKIPGCIDIAMKGSILYVDSAVDLIAIDMSDPFNPVVTHRVREVFGELKPPDNDRVPEKYTKNNRQENTVLIRWEK